MIRSLEKQDIDRVMAIWLTSNIQAHSFIPKEYWQYNFEAVREILPQAEVFIYETEKRILGFIGLSGDYIEGIFVDEAVRSQGIGKQLLDYVKQEHQELYLQVYVENERAESFYKREGFLVEKEEREAETGAIERRMLWRSGERQGRSSNGDTGTL